MLQVQPTFCGLEAVKRFPLERALPCSDVDNLPLTAFFSQKLRLANKRDSAKPCFYATNIQSVLFGLAPMPYDRLEELLAGCRAQITMYLISKYDWFVPHFVKYLWFHPA